MIKYNAFKAYKMLELVDLLGLRNRSWVVLGLLIFGGLYTASAQYKTVPHRHVQPGEIAIDKPGFYGEQGATYVLTDNIVSQKSGIFLGKDVTLDLNGYTLTFATGYYDHIPNSGFEDGEIHWDLSEAPGAKVKNTRDVHIFIGDKLLSLEKGDEVVSGYVNLPEANRSYYAMCGITGRHSRDLNSDLSNEMKISLYVEDEHGEQVEVTTEYQDGKKVSCPVENRSPRLGGGFIIAHLQGLPAGKYRVRVKAETDCLIDEVDIRPAMDVGIGIVENTDPYGHFDHLYDIRHSAFFDYTADISSGRPLDGIPIAEGRGTVTIKNGVIRSGTKGVQSWGVQSTANETKIILDNVKVINQGINSIAVDVPQALITGCTFEVDNPFVINRHGSQFYAVDIRGEAPSEVSFSEFNGGQGCLVFKGNNSSIHNNYFANEQMVTNHYSIMAIGDSSEIFENRIEPKTGSGIEIYRHKGIEIFNNFIKVESSPPTCEYGAEEYSVAAIRIADYNAEPDSKGGAANNKVYNNKIYVTGRAFPEYEKYTPMVWAFFYSASGGQNYIFGNEIFVDHKEPNAKAEASAFYICGGLEGYGGKFYNNRILTNVPAAWIASRYGGTVNTEVYNNTIMRSPTASEDLQPFRMGWKYGKTSYARDVKFYSNRFEGMEFGIDRTNQDHSYEVYWTLEVRAEGLVNKRVVVENSEGTVVDEGRINSKGVWTTELLDFSYAKGNKTSNNTYKVVCGNFDKRVILNKNQIVTIK